MKRPELLALTADDLVAWANRGLVKRAQKELEAGDLSAEWSDLEDGTIIAKWSDQITCTLPGGKTLKDAHCDCGAMEICRHVLRTVFAWQARQHLHVPEPWNPARITDEQIQEAVPKTTRDRAAVLRSQGLLAELLCAIKPSARFHFPGHTVRFTVPDDLRYSQCSCAEPAPCAHAVLAVEAFRLLPPGQEFGIVSDGPLDSPVQRTGLDAGADAITELLIHGLASTPATWSDRLRRAAIQCLEDSLPWPAQILEEIADDYTLYSNHDATFNPELTLNRAGEFLLRRDAILAGCAPTPQAFIRGLKADRDCTLGSSHFIGLGSSIEETRTGTTLNVFLQESDTGHLVTISRQFAEPADEPRKPYHQLATSFSVKDASWASLASGQLLTKGGKRTAAGRLIIGRAKASVNPQNFSWEHLKSPLLVEDFQEILARLRMLPPACFRPRRSGSDFHVCPLQAVTAARFDPATNAITAQLTDLQGQHATLYHPWSSRGQLGADSLLSSLQSNQRPVFVAGHVQSAGPSLLILPTALVFANENGSRRIVQPWIDNTPSTLGSPAQSHPGTSHNRTYAAATQLAIELLLQGRKRLSDRSWPGWLQTIRELEERGLHRMAAKLHAILNQPSATLTFLKLWRLSL